MKPRFPGKTRRHASGGRQRLHAALGMTALLISAQGLAHTELIMNRQSQENAISIETELFGPVQVQLKNSRSGALLFESTLDGPGVFQVTDLPPQSLSNLVLHAVPGKPATASPFTYRIPFSAYADWTISQGFHGRASHDDALNEYAVDFDVTLGTPVLAARTGVVMEVIDDFPDDGQARKSNLEQANIIRILHEDGSMAVYGHLLQGSAVVTLGQWLVDGTVIAQSGNSGYTHGPHLHFAVQRNAGMQLESIPFQMQSVNGMVSMEPDR
ncbi:MAG: M23 family metallopeptidase [Arenimonas sp.]|nr:M23 family metallopeptidase [Arenimonas sp.]